jgi:hypothetical protein
MAVAWFKFMVNAGFDMSNPEGTELPTPPAPSEDERREAGRFFNHELWHTTQYIPDVEALQTSSTRVLVGLGAESGHLLTYQTSTILARLLDNATVEFPGDHGGFMEAPSEFADTLRQVLT